MKTSDNILWVAPGADHGGLGTPDRPFHRIATALEKVQPGQHIVLKAGQYNENVTIEISGTIDNPIYIRAEDGAAVEIVSSSWFLYDVSDFIISHLTFSRCASGAISVIGACQRNSFDSLHFIDCGSSKGTACTLFFGGSGGQCNIVANSRFENITVPTPAPVTASNVSIAIMISEGDADGNIPNTNHIIRNNTIKNYAYGILVGSNDASENDYGHVIENNVVEQCDQHGILIKCGDCHVRSNRIKECRDHAISIFAGSNSIVEENRIVDCGKGIVLLGSGHTVSNNCIVRAADCGLHVSAKIRQDLVSAANIFIEHNTCINCGSSNEHAVNGVRIDPDTSSVIQKNLFYGPGIPVYLQTSAKEDCLIEASKKVRNCRHLSDNIVAGEAQAVAGCQTVSVEFSDATLDDYEHSYDNGAHGWAVRPTQPPPSDETPCIDPECDEPDSLDENGHKEEISAEEALARSLFIDTPESQKQSRTSYPD